MKNTILFLLLLLAATAHGQPSKPTKEYPLFIWIHPQHFTIKLELTDSTQKVYFSKTFPPNQPEFRQTIMVPAYSYIAHFTFHETREYFVIYPKHTRLDTLGVKTIVRE